MVLSRRLFAAAAALLVVAAACDPGAEPAPEPGAGEPPAAEPAPEAPDEAPVDYAEAPELAELVEAGELPPLADRLPAEPLVVEPYEQLGRYGGTIEAAVVGTESGQLVREASYDQLTRWNLDYTETVPNVAHDIEVNEDGTEYTFHLREGMRWSDGEPFTAHDVVFWYEAVVMVDELGSPPAWMVTGGEPGVVEAVDEHTVVFRFPGGGNGLLLERLATPGAAAVTSTPRHYLEQFHADYNPDVEAVVDEHGAADWAELFDLRRGAGQDQVVPDKPVLTPWFMTVDFGDSERLVFERNPYYWKVDPAGNQLPYIDRVVFNVVGDTQVLLLRALSGDIDLHGRHLKELQYRPVLAEHRDDGDYRFFDMVPTLMNVGMLQLNLTHKDPVKREVFQNLDFRIGLSHAIDRQEIIDIVYQGQGEPYQGAPRPDSEFYHERLAKQYTEYDVDLADEHLDAAGYDQRDAEGYRLGPDGQRITIDIDVVADQQPAMADAVELIVGYWDEVGVDARVNPMDRSLWGVRQEDNDQDALIWEGWGGGGVEVILNPRFWFPHGGRSNYAIAWAWWFNDQEGAEEPPEATQRQMELYRQVEATPDADERAELMEEILDIAADQFYAIGLSLSPDEVGIARNSLRNIPETMPFAWEYPTPAPSNPEQYFFED